MVRLRQMPPYDVYQETDDRWIAGATEQVVEPERNQVVSHSQDSDA